MKDKKDGNCGWKANMVTTICIHAFEDRVELENEERGQGAI